MLRTYHRQKASAAAQPQARALGFCECIMLKYVREGSLGLNRSGSRCIAGYKSVSTAARVAKAQKKLD
jgi:hypothetical protein